MSTSKVIEMCDAAKERLLVAMSRAERAQYEKLDDNLKGMYLASLFLKEKNEKARILNAMTGRLDTDQKAVLRASDPDRHRRPDFRATQSGIGNGIQMSMRNATPAEARIRIAELDAELAALDGALR